MEVGQIIIVVPTPLFLKVIAEWLSGDKSQEIRWNTTSDNNVIYHAVGLENPAVFNEISTQAEWGTLYYAMGSVSGNGAICISLFIVDDLGRRKHIQDGSERRCPRIIPA